MMLDVALSPIEHMDFVGIDIEPHRSNANLDIRPRERQTHISQSNDANTCQFRAP